MHSKGKPKTQESALFDTDWEEQIRLIEIQLEVIQFALLNEYYTHHLLETPDTETIYKQIEAYLKSIERYRNRIAELYDRFSNDPSRAEMELAEFVTIINKLTDDCNFEIEQSVRLKNERKKTPEDLQAAIKQKLKSGRGSGPMPELPKRSKSLAAKIGKKIKRIVPIEFVDSLSDLQKIIFSAEQLYARLAEIRSIGLPKYIDEEIEVRQRELGYKIQNLKGLDDIYHGRKPSVRLTHEYKIYEDPSTKYVKLDPTSKTPGFRTHKKMIIGEVNKLVKNLYDDESEIQYYLRDYGLDDISRLASAPFDRDLQVLTLDFEGRQIRMLDPYRKKESVKDKDSKEKDSKEKDSKIQEKIITPQEIINNAFTNIDVYQGLLQTARFYRKPYIKQQISEQIRILKEQRAILKSKDELEIHPSENKDVEKFPVSLGASLLDKLDSKDAKEWSSGFDIVIDILRKSPGGEQKEFILSLVADLHLEVGNEYIKETIDHGNHDELNKLYSMLKEQLSFIRHRDVWQKHLNILNLELMMGNAEEFYKEHAKEKEQEIVEEKIEIKEESTPNINKKIRELIDSISGNQKWLGELGVTQLTTKKQLSQAIASEKKQLDALREKLKERGDLEIHHPFSAELQLLEKNSLGAILLKQLDSRDDETWEKGFKSVVEIARHIDLAIQKEFILGLIKDLQLNFDAYKPYLDHLDKNNIDEVYDQLRDDLMHIRHRGVWQKQLQALFTPPHKPGAYPTSDLLGSEIFDVKDDSSKYALTPDLKQGTSLSSCLYVRPKSGGANSPGKFGGIYIRCYMKDGVVHAQEIFCKQATDDGEPVHRENMSEVMSGQIMGRIVKDSAASTFFITPEGDVGDPSQVYVASVYFDKPESIHSAAHKAIGVKPPKKGRIVGKGKYSGQNIDDKTFGFPDFKRGVAELVREKKDDDPRKSIDPQSLAEGLMSSMLTGNYQNHGENILISGGKAKLIDTGGAFRLQYRQLKGGLKSKEVTKGGSFARAVNPEQFEGRKYNTSYYKAYPEEVIINPKFIAGIDIVANFDKAELIKTTEETIDYAVKYYGEEAFIAHFASKIDQTGELDLSGDMKQKIENTKIFLTHVMLARQFSLQEYSLELKLKNMEKLGDFKMEELARSNPAYFFHKKYTKSQEFYTDYPGQRAQGIDRVLIDMIQRADRNKDDLRSLANRFLNILGLLIQEMQEYDEPENEVDRVKILYVFLEYALQGNRYNFSNTDDIAVILQACDSAFQVIRQHASPSLLEADIQAIAEKPYEKPKQQEPIVEVKHQVPINDMKELDELEEKELLPEEINQVIQSLFKSISEKQKQLSELGVTQLTAKNDFSRAIISEQKKIARLREILRAKGGLEIHQTLSSESELQLLEQKSLGSVLLKQLDSQDNKTWENGFNSVVEIARHIDLAIQKEFILGLIKDLQLNFDVYKPYLDHLDKNNIGELYDQLRDDLRHIRHRGVWHKQLQTLFAPPHKPGAYPSDLLGSEIFDVKDDSSKYALTPDLKQGTTLSSCLYVRPKSGGANSPGKFGGIYIRCYIKDGVVHAQEIFCKQATDDGEPVHRENMSEVMSGQIMGRIVKDSAASTFFITPTEGDIGDPSQIYVASVYFDKPESIHSAAHKAIGVKPPKKGKIKGKGKFSGQDIDDKTWGFPDFKRGVAELLKENKDDPRKKSVDPQSLAEGLMSSMLTGNYQNHGENILISGGKAKLIDTGGAFRLEYKTSGLKSKEVKSGGSFARAVNPEQFEGRKYNTSYYKAYPEEVIINPKFIEGVDIVVNFDKAELIKTTEETIDYAIKYYGAEAFIAHFASKIDQQKFLDLSGDMEQKIKNTKEFLAHVMLARQFSLQEYSLELKLKNMEKRGDFKMEELARNNPAYFFHKKYTKSQEFYSLDPEVKEVELVLIEMIQKADRNKDDIRNLANRFLKILGILHNEMKGGEEAGHVKILYDYLEYALKENRYDFSNPDDVAVILQACDASFRAIRQYASPALLEKEILKIAFESYTSRPEELKPATVKADVKTEPVRPVEPIEEVDDIKEAAPKKGVRVKVFYWPNKNHGFGHISLEVEEIDGNRKEYISWPMRNDISHDIRHHQKDPLIVTHEMEEADYDAFLEKYKKSRYYRDPELKQASESPYGRYGSSYSERKQNCTHCVQDVLAFVGPVGIQVSKVEKFLQPHGQKLLPKALYEGVRDLPGWFEDKLTQSNEWLEQLAEVYLRDNKDPNDPEHIKLGIYLLSKITSIEQANLLINKYVERILDESKKVSPQNESEIQELFKKYTNLIALIKTKYPTAYLRTENIQAINFIVHYDGSSFITSHIQKLFGESLQKMLDVAEARKTDILTAITLNILLKDEKKNEVKPIEEGEFYIVTQEKILEYLKGRLPDGYPTDQLEQIVFNLNYGKDRYITAINQLEQIPGLQGIKEHFRNGYVYVGEKPGGAKRPGKFGALYKRIETGKKSLIKKDTSKIFKTPHPENDISEFLASSLSNYLFAGIAPTMGIKKHPEEDAPYIESPFFDSFKGLYEDVFLNYYQLPILQDLLKELQGIPDVDIIKLIDSAVSKAEDRVGDLKNSDACHPGFNDLITDIRKNPNLAKQYIEKYIADNEKNVPKKRPKGLGHKQLLKTREGRIYKYAVEQRKKSGELRHEGLEKCLVVSIFFADFDTHPENIGVITDSKDGTQSVKRIDFGAAFVAKHFKEKEVHMHSHSLRRHLFGAEPTNHIREFPRSVKITEQFVKDIDTAIEKLRACLESDEFAEILGQIKAWPLKDLEKFAKHIGMKKPFTSLTSEDFVHNKIQPYLKMMLESRIEAMQKLKLEIQISLCVDILKSPVEIKPSKKEELRELILKNRDYFLKGKFHFRGKNHKSHKKQLTKLLKKEVHSVLEAEILPEIKVEEPAIIGAEHKAHVVTIPKPDGAVYSQEQAILDHIIEQDLQEESSLAQNKFAWGAEFKKFNLDQEDLDQYLKTLRLIQLNSKSHLENIDGQLVRIYPRKGRNIDLTADDFFGYAIDSTRGALTVLKYSGAKDKNQVEERIKKALEEFHKKIAILRREDQDEPGVIHTEALKQAKEAYKAYNTELAEILTEAGCSEDFDHSVKDIQTARDLLWMYDRRDEAVCTVRGKPEADVSVLSFAKRMQFREDAQQKKYFDDVYFKKYPWAKQFFSDNPVLYNLSPPPMVRDVPNPANAWIESTILIKDRRVAQVVSGKRVAITSPISVKSKEARRELTIRNHLLLADNENLASLVRKHTHKWQGLLDDEITIPIAHITYIEPGALRYAATSGGEDPQDMILNKMIANKELQKRLNNKYVYYNTETGTVSFYSSEQKPIPEHHIRVRFAVKDINNGINAWEGMTIERKTDITHSRELVQMAARKLELFESKLLAGDDKKDANTVLSFLRKQDTSGIPYASFKMNAEERAAMLRLADKLHKGLFDQFPAETQRALSLVMQAACNLKMTIHESKLAEAKRALHELGAEDREKAPKSGRFLSSLFSLKFLREPLVTAGRGIKTALDIKDSELNHHTSKSVYEGEIAKELGELEDGCKSALDRKGEVDEVSTGMLSKFNKDGVLPEHQSGVTFLQEHADSSHKHNMAEIISGSPGTSDTETHGAVHQLESSKEHSASKAAQAARKISKRKWHHPLTKHFAKKNKVKGAEVKADEVIELQGGRIQDNVKQVEVPAEIRAHDEIEQDVKFEEKHARQHRAGIASVGPGPEEIELDVLEDKSKQLELEDEKELEPEAGIAGGPKKPAVSFSDDRISETLRLQKMLGREVKSYDLPNPQDNEQYQKSLDRVLKEIKSDAKSAKLVHQVKPDKIHKSHDGVFAERKNAGLLEIYPVKVPADGSVESMLAFAHEQITAFVARMGRGTTIHVLESKNELLAQAYMRICKVNGLPYAKDGPFQENDSIVVPDRFIDLNPTTVMSTFPKLGELMLLNGSLDQTIQRAKQGLSAPEPSREILETNTQRLQRELLRVETLLRQSQDAESQADRLPPPHVVEDFTHVEKVLKDARSTLDRIAQEKMKKVAQARHQHSEREFKSGERAIYRKQGVEPKDKLKHHGVVEVEPEHKSRGRWLGRW